MPSLILRRIGEFLTNLLFLAVNLLCHFLIFVCITSLCIGVSVGVSKSYLYFNNVKLSTSLEIYMSLACLIPLSFIQVDCAALVMRQRRILHPCILQIVPDCIYGILYLFAFKEMMYRYIQIHDLPLGITNDGMYVLDDSSGHSPRPLQHHSSLDLFSTLQNYNTKLSFHSIYPNETDYKLHESLVWKKNLETVYFLTCFFYIVYVTGNIVMRHLQRISDDQPEGSIKSFTAYLLVMCLELMLLAFSVSLFYMGRIVLVSSPSLYRDTYGFTKLLMCMAILIGVCAGVLDLASPFPKKRNQNGVLDPYDWYKNILRARIAVMYIAFGFVNWHFFEQRTKSEETVTVTEKSFSFFCISLAGATIHITKIFTIMFLDRATEIVEMFRYIKAGLRDANAIIVPDNNIENPPGLEMSTDDDDTSSGRQNCEDMPLANASTQTLNSNLPQPINSNDEPEINNNVLIKNHDQENNGNSSEIKEGDNDSVVINVIPVENGNNGVEQNNEFLHASVEFGPENLIAAVTHSTMTFSREVNVVDENNNSGEESVHIQLDIIDDLMSMVNEAVRVENADPK